MHKKLFTVLLVAFLLPALFFAQDKKKAPVFFDNNTAIESNVTLTGNAPMEWAGYAVVDTMPNVYGPAIGVLNPVAHDPATGLTAVVYRGGHAMSAGSGELWYSYSTDNGVTWMRSATSVQDGQTADNLARYPSMAISNPDGSSDIADVMLTFAWPELNNNPVQFDWVGYAADLSVDGSDFAAVYEDPPSFSSQVPIWTHDTEPYVYWASDNSEDAGITLFRTSDYTKVDVITPDTWNDAAFGSGGSITNGGIVKDGVVYYSVLGTYPDDVAGFAAVSGWEAGYAKSTDNGDTWEQWEVANWNEIQTTADWLAATPDYDFMRLWDYVKEDEFVSYQGDINVVNGNVHIATGITKVDTNVSLDGEYGENALIEFIHDGTTWDAKVIYAGDLLTDSTFSQYDGVALGQMGPSVYLATDASGEFFVAQFVTHANADSFFCDVYHTYRTKDGDWVDVINQTETPLYNENSTHFSPMLGEDGDNVYAYSFFAYPDPAGVNSHAAPPLTNPTMYYAKTVAIPKTSSVEELDLVATDFELGQNYPNPFNPSTAINYTIPAESRVSLKVYDVLGAEVATLVNSTQKAGSYKVNFNASELASGVYVYELTAGQFSASAKMILMK